MHEHLLVFPHFRLTTPLVAQPIQLACLVSSECADFLQSVNEAIQILAVLVEVDPHTDGRSVVKG